MPPDGDVNHDAQVQDMEDDMSIGSSGEDISVLDGKPAVDRGALIVMILRLITGELYHTESEQKYDGREYEDMDHRIDAFGLGEGYEGEGDSSGTSFQTSKVAALTEVDSRRRYRRQSASTGRSARSELIS